MCLLINQKLHQTDVLNEWPAARVADRDILVTKMLRPQKTIIPYFLTVTHTPARGYRIRFVKGTATLKDEFYLYRGLLLRENVYVANGIHAYTGVTTLSLGIINDCESLYGEIKHWAIIPKGTKYYIGDEGDIVAEKMVIFENDPAFIKYIKKNGVPKRVDRHE